MKKILLVANVAKEHVIKFHIPTIKALTESGWQVDVACSGDEIVPFCNKQYKLSYKRATIDLNLIKGFQEVKKIAQEEKYDVIYCHTVIGGIAGRLAGLTTRKNGTKVIFFDHGFEFCKGGPRIYWMVYYPVEKLLSRITDTIICINQPDYNLVKEKFHVRDKVYYIEGIGMNPERLYVEDRDKIRKLYRNTLSIPEDAFVLIYLAELTNNKNQQMLIDSLKLIHKKYPNTFLVLVGYDHLDGKYQKYAEQKQLSSYIRFLGWREDVGNLYAMSDICVASSVLEGLGINLVEAMYCKLPIVATQNNGHSSVVDDRVNGFLVKRNCAEDMADSVVALMQDPLLREKFVEEGYKKQESFQTKNVINKLIRILNGESIS